MKMKRFEKYRADITCGAYPHALDVILNDRVVGEIRVEDGEVELRHPCDPADPERAPIWREDIAGWGDFEGTERAYFMHECIRRLDQVVDPDGVYGALDPDEPVPEIAGAEPEITA